jgi:hypothetical protein
VSPDTIPFTLRRRVAVAVACVAAIAASANLRAQQAELLPLDHPATAALVRIYEYGGIAEFPREHLPISRGLARTLLAEAAADTTLPSSLREQARYHLVELGADGATKERAVFIATPANDRLVYDDPLGGRPLAILEMRDSAHGASVVLEPLLDLDVRVDPEASSTAIVAQGGLALHGTILDHLGFEARVTNGSVAGDSALAARDPHIARAGAFGIAGFGRDIDMARGHLRLDYDAVSIEVAREALQLGGGLRQSLLVGSMLPSDYDALRLGLRIGRVSYTHLHGSLLPDIAKSVRGVYTRIPNKFIAAHLLSVGPFGGLRLSLGESVIYSERPFEIGYLNPFVFLRSQEHFYRDRDNANMYASLSANPWRGIFLEAEFMLDDMKFSRIGKGFWGNKTAWRIGATARAFPLEAVDIGLSYTRLQPYMYTHFSDTNAYTHDATPLAAGGLPPNSQYVEARLSFIPVPQLVVNATIGVGEHGANVYSGDSLVHNVGGDISQTLRAGDSETVTFLDGDRQKIGRLAVEIEYEALRNVYVRLNGFANTNGSLEEREIRLGIRFGAR